MAVEPQAEAGVWPGANDIGRTESWVFSPSRLAEHMGALGLSLGSNGRKLPPSPEGVTAPAQPLTQRKTPRSHMLPEAIVLRPRPRPPSPRSSHQTMQLGRLGPSSVT